MPAQEAPALSPTPTRWLASPGDRTLTASYRAGRETRAQPLRPCSVVGARRRMPCPDSLEDAGSSKYCQNLRRTQPPRGPEHAVEGTPEAHWGGGGVVPDAQQGSPRVPEFCSVSRGWRRPPPQPPGAAAVTGRGASWPEPARPGLLFYFPGQHSNTGLETRVREAASPREAPGASAASTPPASPGARAPRPAGEAPASAPASHPLVALAFPPPL